MYPGHEYCMEMDGNTVQCGPYHPSGVSSQGIWKFNEQCRDRSINNTGRHRQWHPIDWGGVSRVQQQILESHRQNHHRGTIMGACQNI